MDKADESFLQEFKPLHVPHKYDVSGSLQDKVIYALAQINNGISDEVALKLSELDPSTNLQTLKSESKKILTALFDKGLLKGDDDNGEIRYNLSKILKPNSGKADNLY